MRKNGINEIRGDDTFVRNSPASQLDDASSLVTSLEAIVAGRRARIALESLPSSLGSEPVYENHVVDWMELRLVYIADLYLKAKNRHAAASWGHVRDELVPVATLAGKLASALDAMSPTTKYELADQRNFSSLYKQGTYNTSVLAKELDDLIVRCSSVIVPEPELLQERPYQQVGKGPRPKLYVVKAVDRLCRLFSTVNGAPFQKNLETVRPTAENFVHIGPEFVRLSIQGIDPSVKFGTVRWVLVERGQAKFDMK